MLTNLQPATADTVTLLASHNKHYSLETLRRFGVHEAIWKDATGETKVIAFPQASRIWFPETRTWRAEPCGKGAYLVGDITPQNILITEGEWDMLAAAEAGIQGVATGTAGAGCFKPEWAASLRGKNVVICYDNDEAGRSGAQRVGGRLYGIATSVRIAMLPTDKLGGDISDFLAEHDVSEFRQVLNAAKPYTPPPPPKKQKGKQAKQEELRLPYFVEDDVLYEMCHAVTSTPPVYYTCSANAEIFDVFKLKSGKVTRPPYDDMIENNQVFLPEFPAAPESEQWLLDELCAYIRNHIVLPEDFVELSAYYVLLSWVYDRFNRVPYLHVFGIPGHGKSRFLDTLGRVCYRGLLIGAISPAALFRLVDRYGGTLGLDEQDYVNDDEQAEIIRILLNGYMTGRPVIRSVQVGKKWDLQSFACYGTKILSSVRPFKQEALRSRCISMNVTGLYTRGKPRIHVDDEEWEREGRRLRNFLLGWRYQVYFSTRYAANDLPDALEPRVREIFGPLVSIIHESDARRRVIEFAARFNRGLVVERSGSWEAEVVNVLVNIVSTGDQWITVKTITEDANIDRTEKPLSSRWIGRLLARWGFEKRRDKKGVMAFITQDKVAVLAKQFGVEEVAAETDEVPF